MSHASIPTSMRSLPADLVRISVGIEDWRYILSCNALLNCLLE